MEVRLIQFASSTNSAANLSALRRLVSDGTWHEGEPDRLVVLPEAAMCDFGPPERSLGPMAQPLDGPFVAALAELAGRHRATIVAGMFELSPDAGRPFNTLVAVNPAGELVATYRKTHLYDSFGYRESDRVLPGSGAPVTLPVGGLTLGLMTCYDLRFPELARLLVDAGADTLVVPAAWVRGRLKEDHWVTLLRARAIENTAYVLAAAQCGSTYVGRSMVVAPDGAVVVELGVDEGVAAAQLSPQLVEEVRRSNPSLANRRLGRS